MSEADLTAQPDAAVRPLPGERLAAAREGRGMTVAEIAQQLKLSPWQVEALEAGNYGRLPSPVFVRGFIRNYARLVKLDPAELLEGVDKPAPVAVSIEPPAVKSSPEVYFPGPQQFNWRPYALAGAIVVIALGIYEFYPESTPEQPAPVAQSPAPGAADYPARAVRVIVSYGPGGATDIMARLIALKLGENLRRPFVVENRSGAMGVLAVFLWLGITALAFIWVERRVVGRMQNRIGPNRVGPRGLLHPQPWMLGRGRLPGRTPRPAAPRWRRTLLQHEVSSCPSPCRYADRRPC